MDSCLAVTTRNPTPYTPWIAWIPTWIAGNNSKRQTTTSEGPSLQSKRVGMQRVAGPAVISSAFQLPAVISSAFQLQTTSWNAVISSVISSAFQLVQACSYLVCIPTRCYLVRIPTAFQLTVISSAFQLVWLRYLLSAYTTCEFDTCIAHRPYPWRIPARFRDRGPLRKQTPSPQSLPNSAP